MPDTQARHKDAEQHSACSPREFLDLQPPADADAESHRGVTEYVASLMPQAELKAFPGEGEWPRSRDEVERYARPRLDAIQRFIGVEPKRVLKRA
jgi:hypothetical protein